MVLLSKMKDEERDAFFTDARCEYCVQCGEELPTRPEEHDCPAGEEQAFGPLGDLDLPLEDHAHALLGALVTQIGARGQGSDLFVEHGGLKSAAALVSAEIERQQSQMKTEEDLMNGIQPPEGVEAYVEALEEWLDTHPPEALEAPKKNKARS
jgi:hypothetical protein